MTKYLSKAFEAVKDSPGYAGRFAKDLAHQAKKDKFLIAGEIAAIGAAWLGVNQHPDSYFASLIPQIATATAAAAEAYRAAGKDAGKMKKFAYTVAGGLLGAGLYEGWENLNRIPGLSEMLAGNSINSSPDLGKEFAGQRPGDIPVAGAAGAALAYAGRKIDGTAKKIAKKQ